MECASPASAPTPSDSVEQASLPPPGDADPLPDNPLGQPQNKLQDQGTAGLNEVEGGSSAARAAQNGCTVVKLQHRAAVMFTSGQGAVEPSGEPPVAASNATTSCCC